MSNHFRQPIRRKFLLPVVTLTAVFFVGTQLQHFASNLSLARLHGSGNIAWSMQWTWDKNGQLELIGLTDFSPTELPSAQAPCADAALDSRVFVYLATRCPDDEHLEAALRHLVDKDARSWETLALAKLYEVEGEHDQALRVLRLGRNIDGALRLLSGRDSAAGRLGYARRLALLALEIDPDNPDNYYFLGSLLVNHGLGADMTNDFAVQLFRKGLVLDPDNPHMLLGLAHALELSHRYGEAIPLLLQLQSRLPQDATVYLLLGDAFLAEGSFDSAENGFSRALELAPDQVWALYGLGRVYVEKGSVQSAVKIWTKALALAPDFAPALQALNEVSASDDASR